MNPEVMSTTYISVCSMRCAM